MTFFLISVPSNSSSDDDGASIANVVFCMYSIKKKRAYITYIQIFQAVASIRSSALQ